MRPRTRGDCVNGARPCPWVSCQYHLMLDVDRNGVLHQHWAFLEDMPETCALDVADKAWSLTPDGTALDYELAALSVRQLGQLLNCTNQSISVALREALWRARPAALRYCKTC